MNSIFVSFEENLLAFPKPPKVKTWMMFGEEAGEKAWEALVRRAVLGFGPDTGEVYGQMLHAPGSEEAVQAAEAFMHEMESWSIYLQRHCPADWNQFSAVVLQCLSGGIASRCFRDDAFTV